VRERRRGRWRGVRQEGRREEEMQRLN